MDRGTALTSFQAVTSADEPQALQYLEATDWNLEAAINLFLSDPQSAQPVAPLARQSEASGGPVLDEVRQPIPARIDQLYDARVVSEATARSRRNMRAGPQPVDAFRDYQAEGHVKMPGVPAAPQQGLAGLFAPPHKLMFRGSFQEAVEAAERSSQWLLINIQDNNEFASHQLNRDTWSDDNLQSVLSGSFIFWQAQRDAQEGEHACQSYKLHDLPAIAVIDPVTRACASQWAGYIDPHRLVEELVPFMDHKPNDPTAGRLGHAQRLKRRLTGSQAAPASPSSQAAAASPKPALSEEDELAAAIAASLEQSSQEPSQAGAASSSLDGLHTNHRSQPAAAPASGPSPSSLAAMKSFPPTSSLHGTNGSLPGSTAMNGAAVGISHAGSAQESVEAEARNNLPPEPSANEPGCRIAVRMPDGKRLARRFSPDHTLAAVAAFCIIEEPEAARGRPFQLAKSGIGSGTYEDLTESIAAAGAGNSIMTMRWMS
ncbi:hypothetical protein WJX74_005836 [Apatococcus lobatus]|uniref:UBX domain-containing protein n=1 Tax=Apatococcus lobatus TaxID=904363 RepID=A0AAW1QUG2_9CHLO